MEPIDVFKSWGFAIILLSSILIIILAAILGWVDSGREVAYVVITELLLTIIYFLTRLWNKADEPVPFAKNWKW